MLLADAVLLGGRPRLHAARGDARRRLHALRGGLRAGRDARAARARARDDRRRLAALLKAMARAPELRERDLSSIRAGNLYAVLPAELRPTDPELRSNSLGMTETCGPHTSTAWTSSCPSRCAARSATRSRASSTRSSIPRPDATLAARRGRRDLRARLQPDAGPLQGGARGHFDADGFYHTGDAGYFDADGVLFFKGRLGEMIKTARRERDAARGRGRDREPARGAARLRGRRARPGARPERRRGGRARRRARSSTPRRCARARETRALGLQGAARAATSPRRAPSPSPTAARSTAAGSAPSSPRLEGSCG